MNVEEIRCGLIEICSGLQVDPLVEKSKIDRDPSIQHAPNLTPNLTKDEKRLAITNALRYFPPKTHNELSVEFYQELQNYGHIYMYRFRPKNFILKAYPFNLYPAKCQEAAAIMHMIMNNLDNAVAQFPQELVCYGGNGQVFSNWAQFRLVMNYLSNLTSQQTLVLYSGHPLGLFPSPSTGPRLVISNGLMIPNYSQRDNYDKLFALGVTMYGQMTAGSFCYIGPQGIVHGTTLTLLNAGRKYLKIDDLGGKVFVTSGLGGMSGAQAKASVIAGCVGVIAEINEEAVEKRYRQGWLDEKSNDLDVIIDKIKKYRKEKKAISIAYIGNIVDLWERIVDEKCQKGEMLVDLGSDQTSCHNPFVGGYYPVGFSYQESLKLMNNDPQQFRNVVQTSLVRHCDAINYLSSKGMKFWDYGNAFLLEASRAGAEVVTGKDKLTFRYPSYVQHIMGDIFSLGFGPFRWVCISADESDLRLTDQIAIQVITNLMEKCESDNVKKQYADNLKWIKEAEKHKLVVGSQARILYSDLNGRRQLAIEFNKAVSEKRLKGPIVISRDHHDVSGTDSPFRETSNIYDGSAITADMAVQNAIGIGFRGASWLALHNGGGVGWGEVINGGFGLVLDGSLDADERARMIIGWDVINGIARRAWSGNEFANEIVDGVDKDLEGVVITRRHRVDMTVLKNMFK